MNSTVHDQPANDTQVLDTFALEVEDSDGDVAGNTLTVTVVDDGPSIDVTKGVETGVLLETYDENTKGAAYDTDQTTADFSSIFAIAGAPGTAYGADGPGSTTALAYTFGLADGDHTASDLSSQGHAIFLYINDAGTLVTGSWADTEGGVNTDNTVFTLSVDGSGVVTLTQYQQLDHPIADDPTPTETPFADQFVSLADGKITLTATATITEFDGDTATDSETANIGANIKFYDDGPVFLAPDAAHVEDLATVPPITELINFNAGADGIQSVVFTGITEGDPALDGDGNQLYYQGQALTYHLDGNVLTAETSANAVGFTLTINPDYQTYTFNSNGVISNGTETTATESDVINPGIAPFVVLTDLGTTSQDAIITGTDSINTSQTIGIGNQNITAGEGIRFDLVNNAVFKPYGGPSTYDRFTYSDHNLTTRFSQNVAWTDNPADTANIIVYAIVADNDGAGDLQASDLYNDSSGGDTYIGLSAANVVVYDGENPTPLIQGTDYFVTDNGDSVTISGLMQGWIFEIITDDTHPFNAVQIEGAADTDAFKLGYFSYGENTPGDPIELNYDIIGTDGDGDTITGNIDVTLYPDPVTYMGTSGGETIDANLVAPGVTDNVLLADGGDDAVFGRLGNDVLDGNQGNDHLYGNEGDDKLYGGSGNDQLDGGDGADLLSGGSGDDLLDGGSGADTLDGGIGNDTLTGGLGTDTFKAGEGHDTIMDYNQAENDVVDISHVLDSAEEDHSRLGVIENAGKAELVIYDNAAHDNAIGSVTFDTINFSTLTPGDELNSLLGQVDVDHTA